MSELVYVASWEIQCCGEEFAVGDHVEWPVRPTDHADPYWEPLLGPERTSRLRGSYARHEEEETPRVSGTVRGIRTVVCRMAPHPPPADQRERHTVPGSGRFEPIDAIDQWYDVPDDPLGLRFCGWLVDLDLDG